MKKTFIPLFAGLLLLCAHQSQAQEFKEHISKEFTLQKDAAASTLAIYNVFGPVKVEGYAGSKVMIEVDKTISAKDNAALETGKQEFKLDFIQTSDSITAYIAEPHDSRPRRWDNHYNDKRIDYEYKLEFTVKIPYSMNLHASTVLNGEVNVQDVAGILDIGNVNGNVVIKNAKQATNATTVNGDITVDYASNPDGGSSFHTINGTIKVNYKTGLSADMEFKTMHGDFYTDFPDAQNLPVNAVKTEEKNAKGSVYRLNKVTTVRFGSGGRTFKFETLNGNVYIKKQS
jgi:hypothetical protein